MMAHAFSAVRAGAPWSYAALVHEGLTDVIDDEQRPVLERRSNPAVRVGVVTELRTCPYHDARHGRMMNVSALQQMTGHLENVSEEISSFRAALPTRESRWSDALTTVVDALGAPVLHLLRTPGSTVVPAVKSVAHKVAAGYFAVIRSCLVAQACEMTAPATVEHMMHMVHATRALLGESEVCAGPMPLIVRIAELFLAPQAKAVATVDTARVRIATRFRQQIQLGICWEIFDAVHEKSVVQRLGEEHPRTDMLARRLAARKEELSLEKTARALPQNALDDDLAPTQLAAIRAVLAGEIPKGNGLRAAMALLGEGHAAGFAFRTPEGRASLTSGLEGYAAVYETFTNVLRALEEDIRREVAVGGDSVWRLHPTVLPNPRALGWYESSLGFRTTLSPGTEQCFTFTPLPRPSVSTGYQWVAPTRKEG